MPHAWLLALGALACARAPLVPPAARPTAATPQASIEGEGSARVTLLAGGDVTLGAHYEEWIDGLRAEGAPPGSLTDYGFRGVQSARAGVDLFLVNLECPFTERGERVPKNFNFRARPEGVATLRGAEVSAVSLANNHVMDWGADGLADTLATLDAAGIAHFGAGRTLAEARAPALLTVRGLRIALLGYLFLGEAPLEPPQIWATDSGPGVAGTSGDLAALTPMVQADVRAASARADVVLCFFHWGREGRSALEPYQRTLAVAAAEAGATVVLGSHPHVLQGIERIGGTPVFYSLGNFVFGGNWNPRNKEGLLVRLALARGRVTHVDLLPIQTDHAPEAPFQPTLLDGGAAEGVLQHLRESSAGFPISLPELGRAGGPLPDDGP